MTVTFLSASVRTERSARRLLRLSAAVVACLLFIVAIVTGCGVVYQSACSWWDRHALSAPGKLVTVDGIRMHLVLSGRSLRVGEPTVVLETGLGSMSSAWGWIQPEVAKFARVVSYDRAGLGWSDADPRPESGERDARRLHALLVAAGVKGPYLLVGHSMGGLLVRVFNDLYPGEVAGMVLLDPCHPDQHLRSVAIREYMLNGFRMLKSVPFLTRIGYVRVTDYLDGQAEGLPPRQFDEARSFLCSYQHLKTTNDEASNWASLCAEVRKTRPLAGKPLTVLTAGKGIRPGGLELQQELARLSSRGKQVLVEGATMSPW
jgi:pimeloyl-ACP methyl ester carboxylesterase